MRKTIALSIALLLATAASAATRLVPDEYPTIQAAINDCNDGDVVIVEPNTYTGPGNRDIDFKSLAITVRSIDPNDSNVVAATIIDCNGTEAEPHRGFYFHSEEESNSVLDGLTISGGYGPQEQIPGGGEASAGGAIFCKNSSPRIANCIIKDNFAFFGGGGCFDGSSSRLTNCTFSGNRVVDIGGGMCNWESNPTLTNCTFTGNVCIWSGGGGGMFNYQSSPTLTNCAFRGNSGGGGGGGMTNYNGSSPTLTNCAFTGNSAPCVWLTGGGGGGMNNRDYSSPTLTNCTFSGNWASEGGGMSNENSNPILVNCTFYKNMGMGDRNGIVNWWADTCPTLRNCILRDGGNEIWNRYGSTIMISYSDIQGGWPGLGNIDADPCFVEPGYWDANGTPTDANDDFWVDGDYHLKSEGWQWDSDANQWTWDEVTSRCIDAGNPGCDPRDEPLPNYRNRINMGAYGGTAEASIPPHDWALLSDVTNDGTVDFTDFAHLGAIFTDQDDQLPCDFDRDGKINLADLSLLTEDWLKETTWHD